MLQLEVARTMSSNDTASETGALRLPLIVRTSKDLKTLRSNPRAVRRLPRDGIRIAVDGLNDAEAQQLRAQICDYIRSCGCAEGAVTALAALVGVIVAITTRIAQFGVQWSDLGFLILGTLLTVSLGGIAKVFGLAVARWRFKRFCTAAIRIIDRA